MPCTITNFVDYTTTPTTYFTSTVCWPDDGGDDTYRPPVGGGSESGISDGGPVVPPNFGGDPSGGTVVVPGTSVPEAPVVDLNPGWNSGAFSIDSVPPDWAGTVSFDIPDVGDSRPAGVAVGFCPASQLPTAYRNGYDHLLYGLVFTETEVKVVHEGAVVLVESYAAINAERTAVGTDEVQALLYGDSIQWLVNGLPLFGGAFSMTEDFALDAVLYLAYDAVDNPKFLAEEWPVLDGQLRGALPSFTGSTAGLANEELTGSFAPIAGKLSDGAYAELSGALGALHGAVGVGEGAQGSIGALSGYLSEKSYTTVLGAIGRITGSMAGWSGAGEVSYAALTGVFPRLTGTMTSPPTGRLEGTLPKFIGRITAETSYSELTGSLPGLRGTAYGGGVTPLVQVMELVGYYAPSYISAYLVVTAVEYVQSTTTATVDATLTADATEQITAQDTSSVLATMIDAVAERIGLGERVTSLVFRITSGALVDEGQAWVVNTGNDASTRYDTYGFNSFATVGGKQYGAKADGLYLLEGDDDAGQPITAGVALGKQDFGTQALKSLAAVHVGVSSSGKMLLRVGDGKNTYTYMSRRSDAELRAQRFDTGRGLRANYFTFDLVGEGDSFELDNVTFNVAASNRKI